MQNASLFDLSGRVALVTGSVRGLGLAIAQGLAEAGAAVVINGRQQAAVASTAAALRARGLTAQEACFDVTDIEAARGVLDQIGRIDILVNNAGLQRRADFLTYSPEDWDALVATNLTSVFRLSQLAAGGMIARKRGKIINLGSLASQFGRPRGVPYSATKGGIKLMTQAIAAELAPHNIQVNAIGPGFFRTELNRPLFTDPATDSWVKGRTPSGRWGEPAELQGCAVFLASPASDFVNGQIIYVDGGVSAVL